MRLGLYRGGRLQLARWLRALALPFAATTILWLAGGAAQAQAGECAECVRLAQGVSAQVENAKYEITVKNKGASSEETRKVMLEWDESFNGRYWTVSKLQGGVLVSDTSGEPYLNCTGKLTESPNGEAYFTEHQTEGRGGAPADQINLLNDAYESGNWLVTLSVPFGIEILQSDAQSSACDTQELTSGAWLSPPEGDEVGEAFFAEATKGAKSCLFVGTYVEDIEFPPGSSYTVPEKCEAERKVPGYEWNATLAQTLTFSSPGVVSPLSTGPTSHPSQPPPQAPYGPQFWKGKEEALEDLREHALPDLQRYCGPAVAGLLGVVFGGLTNNIYFAAAGGLTAAAYGPFCGPAVARAVKDYKTHSDPPLASIDVLARPAASKAVTLPSCRRYHGDVASFCKRLRSAYTSMVMAAQRLAAITTAIEETVSREHAAYLANDEAAINAQDSELKTLTGERTGAAAAEARSGKGVAKILQAAHISFEMSKKQSAKAIALIEHDLAKAGITASQLSAVDGAALKPAATNLLSDLAHL